AVGHDQVEREVLDEELRVVLDRLAVERVQDGVAGTVGCGAGALHRRAVAEVLHVAAERALVDATVFGTGERNAVVLELVDRSRSLASEVFHGVGVAQPVRALDGRSEEHTSELQSRENLVCRLLLDKKKKSFGSAAEDAPGLRHPAYRRP